MGAGMKLLSPWGLVNKILASDDTAQRAHSVPTSAATGEFMG